MDAPENARLPGDTQWHLPAPCGAMLGGKADSRLQPGVLRAAGHALPARALLIDNPVEQRLLGPVALVAVRIRLRCKC